MTIISTNVYYNHYIKPMEEEAALYDSKALKAFNALPETQKEDGFYWDINEGMGFKREWEEKNAFDAMQKSERHFKEVSIDYGLGDHEEEWEIGCFDYHNHEPLCSFKYSVFATHEEDELKIGSPAYNQYLQARG